MGENSITQTESHNRECIRNGSGLLHKQGIITVGGMWPKIRKEFTGVVLLQQGLGQ